MSLLTTTYFSDFFNVLKLLETIKFCVSMCIYIHTYIWKVCKNIEI